MGSKNLSVEPSEFQLADEPDTPMIMDGEDADQNKTPAASPFIIAVLFLIIIMVALISAKK